MLHVRDVMQTNIRTVEPTLPLAELERILIDNGVSGMPVVQAGALCGVVSRSDVVRAMADAEGDAGTTLAYYQDVANIVPEPIAAAHMASERLARMRVRDAMTPELITLAADRPVREAAQTMAARGVHRVLATEGPRLLGIVTTADLVRAIADGRLHD